ncbi:TetR family transcriptional regulator [Microbacterium sp. NPDC096154]|uniref:TetR/AcrR family transcriptional regulator n=1 Tax=Microbacterium sp. NPDC096154 TaxID=3155549 RepID=UPI003331955A
MGQRQDLLAGARKCLAEKGYSRTTARDITAASGANLAAIGYHFGSKEALLNAAVLESFDEWGNAIEEAMAVPYEGEPIDRLEGFLALFLAGSAEHRTTLVASVQAFAEAEFVPEIRQQLAAAYDGARRGIAAMLLDVEPDRVRAEDLALGSLALAIISGIALQLFIAPEPTPSARELAVAIKTLVHN